MKTRLLFIIAAIFLLASCESLFTIYPTVESMDSTITFTANTESKAETRTSLSYSADENGMYSLTWNRGDEISIYDGTSTGVFSTDDSYSATAEFKQKRGETDKNAAFYTAFYPASITVDNMVLPSQQTYVSNGILDFPMYAYSTDRNLQFKNICGILKISMKTKESTDVSVSSISVSSEKGMSGTFTVADDYSAVVEGDDGVVLNCEEPVRLYNASYQEFNIIVPPGAYEAMKICITTKDGRSINLVANSAVKIDRSSMTHVKVSLGEFAFDSSLEMIPVVDSDVEFTER